LIEEDTERKEKKPDTKLYIQKKGRQKKNNKKRELVIRRSNSIGKGKVKKGFASVADEKVYEGEKKTQPRSKRHCNWNGSRQLKKQLLETDAKKKNQHNGKETLHSRGGEGKGLKAFGLGENKKKKT